jgi:hypothetical protein
MKPLLRAVGIGLVAVLTYALGTLLWLLSEVRDFRGTCPARRLLSAA